MNAEDWVALVQAFAWPVIALFLGLLFRTPVVLLVNHLTDLVKRGKAVTVTYGSTSIAVETERSEELVGSLLELVRGMTANTANEQKLFRIVLDQPPKGLELNRAFERKSAYHDTLRSLRDRNIIQPAERGSWSTGKHAAVTRIGHALLGIPKLRSEMIAAGYPNWWKDEYKGERFHETA